MMSWRSTVAHARHNLTNLPWLDCGEIAVDELQHVGLKPTGNTSSGFGTTWVRGGGNVKFWVTHSMWVSISSLPEVFPASLLREPGEVGHIWLRDASCVPPSVLLLLSEQQTVK